MQLKGKTAIVTGSSRGWGRLLRGNWEIWEQISFLTVHLLQPALMPLRRNLKLPDKRVVAKGDVKNLKMLRTWLKRQWMLSEELTYL